ncbi:KPN_02809 family neutral zinc metallopeptidase [Labrys wisconsinensis]|uniref:Metalloprotease n=1 Tax=Labrys wisconsinensis TaxID=425677 RepID=A0ABU0J8B6_9HYPH|nr:neutral zinc metallopeptidase [Labrys wisconsinensis]MDQ0470514.1 putative metalloprotease [Labrys wisconsinensis]
MRLDDFRQSDNVEDRRASGGGGLPVGKGGIGLGGLVVVLLISYFTGINPATLIGGYEAINGGGGSVQPQQQQRQLTPEEQASGQFVRQVLGSTEDTWTALFKEQNVGIAYSRPTLVLFDGSTSSACGSAQSAMGPFYCPNDRKVYLDTEFFDEMRNRFNACPAGQGACSFAQAYVIAHEIGHHVQNLLGILPKVNQARQRMNDAQSNALSVRTELQADCFAGVWANRTQQQYKFIDENDVKGALQTAQAIGDDMLQKKAQGYVVPDSFTHGSAAQRQRWFINGLKSGQINACDTFSATQL